MNSVDLNTFYQAIQLDRDGDKAAAHAALNKLRIYYPNDPNLLLWLTFTSTDPVEAKGLVETIMLLDPQNSSLDAAQQWVKQQIIEARQKAREAAVSKPNAIPVPETPVKIPFMFRRRVESELAKGEYIIWAEQPNLKILLKGMVVRRALILAALFLLGLVGAIFAGNVMGWIGVALLLVIATLATLLMPFLLYSQASKTLYVLTNRRLLLTCQNWAVLGPNSLASSSETNLNNLVWKSYASYDRINLEKLAVVEREKEFGDLLFEEKTTGVDGLTTYKSVGCVCIKDPTRLRQMVELVYTSKSDSDYSTDDLMWDSGING